MIVGFTVSPNPAGTNLTLAYPSGTQQGDLLILSHYHQWDALPAGWTAIRDVGVAVAASTERGLLYRTAGTETSVTYTTSNSGPAIMVALRGFSGGPIYGSTQNNWSQPAGTTAAGAAGALELAFQHAYITHENDWAPDLPAAGYTERHHGPSYALNNFGARFDSIERPAGATLPAQGFPISTGSGAAYFRRVAFNYQQPPSAPGAITSPADGSTHNASINLSAGQATDPETAQSSLQYEWSYSANNGGAWTVIPGLTAAGTTAKTWNTSALPAGTAYKVRVRAYDGTSYGPYSTQAGTFAIQHNLAPTAPTPTNPIGGAPVDKDIDHNKTWTFNDPDPGDTQSAYLIEDRPVGGATTSTGWVTSTTPSRTIAGGTIAAGNREWRVQTKDAAGEPSPFSSWTPYVVASAPAPPTITSHVNGDTIGTTGDALAWSTPNQDGHQVRKLADATGSPNTATVYSDTGTSLEASATPRNHPLEFPVNNRWEHLQVRIKHGGLWSTWASVRVQVSYTPPPVPTLTLTVNNSDGTISVAITNPAPGAGEPMVTANRVFRRKLGDTGNGDRLATNVTPSGTFVDVWADSHQPYEYRAEALGANNTSTFSTWTSTTASTVTSTGDTVDGGTP